MAMLAAPISRDISTLFNALNIDGNRDPSDHITMFYFDDDVSIKKLCKIIGLVYDITNELKPFEASSSEIISFPENKHGEYPIVAKVKSSKLMSLRENIAKVFDDNKIKYSKKFPEYKPHLTVSYSEEKVNMKFDPIKWSINSIALYGGDNGEEKLFVSFPFNLNIKKSSEYINYISTIYKKASIK